MSRAKQIAEMTRIAYETEVFDESDAEIAIDEGLLDHLVNLYNAGYRKASDVAREIIDHIEVVLNKMFDEYAVLGQADCCMITEIIWRKLSAELKKKYTEGEG